MSTLALLGCALGAVSFLQESRAHFDAPVIKVGPYDTPYRLGLDFDGDGDTDVLGMDKYHDDAHPAAAHELALFRNTGDGRLPKAWERDWVSTTDRTAPAFVTAGNYFGDARDEIFYTWGTEVRVYQWDPLAQGAREIGTNVNAGQALDATSADFDGDGHENPAVLLADRVQIHVVGASVLIVDVPIPGGTWTRLLPLDVDGDGASELLLVGPRRFALLSPGRPHRHVRPSSAHLVIDHEMPAVGDIDGDGDEDAVVFGMEVYQVLRNVGGVLRVEAPVRGGPATGLADIDQDGDLDGVCCSGGGGGPEEVANNAPSRFELSINDGTGRFERAFALEAIGSKGLAAVTDLDGDGDVDLVAGRVIHYADGPLRAPLPALDPLRNREHRAVDMDGDGDVDLGFGAGGAAENLGDGTTRPSAPRLPVLAGPLRYDGAGIPGDFDADGDLDLLVDKWSDATYLGAFLLGNAGGEVYAERGFAFQPSAPLATAAADAANVQVIDVDQDGLPDLLLPGNHPHGLLWNDGPAGFDPFPSGEIVGAAGDLDGDGIRDLVCAWGGIGTDIGVRKGLGGRAFGPRASIWLLNDVDAGFTVLDRLALADVTGDGVLDIGLVDRNAGRLVLMSGVAGTLSFTSVPVFGPLFPDLETHGNRVYATDVDRDGALELVATPVGYELWPDMNTMAVLKRDGASWSWSRHMGSPRAFRDVDGDGDADLVTERIVRNRTVEGPEAGACAQFGAGLAGLDGLTPKLGATGPFRVGETVTLRIACGRGGATATLVRGRSRADWVQGGVPVYVDPADAHYATTTLALAGAQDSAGTGTAELAFVVPAADAGVTTYFQVLVDDAAAVGGVSSSNGLALTIGELP